MANSILSVYFTDSTHSASPGLNPVSQTSTVKQVGSHAME